ncbi:MAG: ABC transporter substrate-binding protein [Eubacterium sp.]
MKPKILAFLLSLFLCIGLITGCSQTTPTQTDPAKATKTITDCAGRTVEIPQKPERVACLYASTAHITTLLGKEDTIVGIPKGIKRDVLMQRKRPDIGTVSVPFQESSINIEELLKINADLVLIRQSTAENSGETEKLKKAGIPYVVVDYTTIDTLKQAISVTGAVFDEHEKANAYNAFCDETLALVQSRLADLPEDQKISLYHAVNEAARTDLAGDICSEITTRAGSINVALTGGSLISEKEKTMTTLEQIYTWNPEVFIVNDFNTANYIRTDPKWTGLNAVQQGKVINLPVGVTRWCHPGSMEPQMATLFIAKTLYPDRFADIDLPAYTRDYYEKYFGLALDEEEINAVLSGEGMRAAK